MFFKTSLKTKIYEHYFIGDEIFILLKNDWNFKVKRSILDGILALFLSKKAKKITIDFKSLKSLDYALAIYIKNSLDKSKKEYKFINLNQTYEKIFDFVSQKTSQIENPENRANLFFQIGKNLSRIYKDIAIFLNFLGEYLFKFSKLILQPKTIRPKEILSHFQDAGMKSVFIVCLTSLLIGIVLAYQGSALLKNFGANMIIVEMMGILTLREIAPLIAAIIVAGRLASSFTAQIGVMKITQEIEAMKTMGFDPFNFLVLPRIVALIIAMPLIVFLADIAGIFGEIIVANNYLGIGYESYLARFNQEVDIKHLYIGLFKAPFFGIVVAFIGCMWGFEVNENTQSIGKYTTISVVNAIFCVIVVDALFSILFTQFGI